MTVTAASFKTARPEFVTASDALVTEALATAALRVDASQYGTGYDHALSLKAAHLLWDSPFGVSMRRDGGAAAASPYETELATLRIERVPRILVL
jgi:Protein of unknown function (DUF4054)